MIRKEVKAKLSVLWIFVAVGMSAYFTLFYMLLGIIEGVTAGEVQAMTIDETLLLVYALFWMIPLIMAFLTLILKNSLNRWGNIIVGLGFFVVGIMINLSSGYTSIAHHLIDALMYIVTSLIVWYAWKWKKD